MRVISVLMLLVALAAPAAVIAEDGDPSVKDGAKEVGRAIENDAVEGYDKTKDATLHGVGTAVDKTGEGLDKAGRAVEGAGEKVKEKAE